VDTGEDVIIIEEEMEGGIEGGNRGRYREKIERGIEEEIKRCIEEEIDGAGAVRRGLRSTFMV